MKNNEHEWSVCIWRQNYRAAKTQKRRLKKKWSDPSEEKRAKRRDYVWTTGNGTESLNFKKEKKKKKMKRNFKYFFKKIYLFPKTSFCIIVCLFFFFF